MKELQRERQAPRFLPAPTLGLEQQGTIPLNEAVYTQEGPHRACANNMGLQYFQTDTNLPVEDPAAQESKHIGGTITTGLSPDLATPQHRGDAAAFYLHP